MHVLQLFISSVLFSRSFAALLTPIPTPTPSTSDATITPGPRIELLRKQNDAQYMGWLSYDGTWSAESCVSGATFYQYDEYWGCCSTADAGCQDMPHACISGSLIYSLTASTETESLLTVPCTLAYSDLTDQSFTVCNTGYLFQNEQDNRPLTNVNCGVSALNWSYYRVPPSSATATTTPSVTTPSQTSTGGPTRTSVPPPDPDPEVKEKSKAWIAGAVIGPIVGIALIGFLLWFCLVKRKKKPTTTVQAPHAAGAPAVASAYQQQSANTNQPPQYYPPAMQQDQAAPGMVPYGVAKQDNWASPQSPVQMSPTQQPAQQWPQQGSSQMGGQAAYAPSPAISPQPLHAQPAQYPDNAAMYKHSNVQDSRPFSSELEGSGVQR